MMFGKSLHWIHSFIKQHNQPPENINTPHSNPIDDPYTEWLFTPPNDYYKRSMEIYKLIGTRYNEPDVINDLLVELLPEIEGPRLYYVTCMLWQGRHRYSNYNKLLKKGLLTTDIPDFYQRRLDGTP